MSPYCAHPLEDVTRSDLIKPTRDKAHFQGPNQTLGGAQSLSGLHPRNKNTVPDKAIPDKAKSKAGLTEMLTEMPVTTGKVY